MVLLTAEASKLGKPFEAFLSFALANSQDTVRFVHVYSNRQQEFASTLLPDIEAFQGKSGVSILERRNTAGRVVFKTLEEPWTGSESDQFMLLGYLDQLRKDPAFLSSEAVLPDLTDELAPVSIRVGMMGKGWGIEWQERAGIHRGALLGCGTSLWAQS